MFDDKVDNDVDNIISQLKSQTKSFQPSAIKEKVTLEKKDIEEFILNNASSVVTGCVDMLQTLTEEVRDGADARMIESIAELAKAATSAIDALSKLKLSDDKIKGQKEIKQMDLDAKSTENLPNNNGSGIYLNREDLIKHLVSYKESKAAEAKTVDV